MRASVYQCLIKLDMPSCFAVWTLLAAFLWRDEACYCLNWVLSCCLAEFEANERLPRGRPGSPKPKRLTGALACVFGCSDSWALDGPRAKGLPVAPASGPPDFGLLNGFANSAFDPDLLCAKFWLSGTNSTGSVGSAASTYVSKTSFSFLFFVPFGLSFSSFM